MGQYDEALVKAISGEGFDDLHKAHVKAYVRRTKTGMAEVKEHDDSREQSDRVATEKRMDTILKEKGWDGHKDPEFLKLQQQAMTMRNEERKTKNSANREAEKKMKQSPEFQDKQAKRKAIEKRMDVILKEKGWDGHKDSEFLKLQQQAMAMRNEEREARRSSHPNARGK